MHYHVMSCHVNVMSCHVSTQALRCSCSSRHCFRIRDFRWCVFYHTSATHNTHKVPCPHTTTPPNSLKNCESQFSGALASCENQSPALPLLSVIERMALALPRSSSLSLLLANGRGWLGCGAVLTYSKVDSVVYSIHTYSTRW